MLLMLKCNNIKKDFKTEIKAIMNLEIEHSLISKGDNFPDFNPYSDSLDYYLFLIHNEIPLSQIEQHTFFTKHKIDSINNLLIGKNWLKLATDKLLPTIFIANQENGKYLYEKAKPISELIVNNIENFMPIVLSAYNKLDLSKDKPFKELSFLILSNVLLDSWQIDNVENEFLKAPIRPYRNEKNYYYSIMELTGQTEAFGIYGNQYEEIDNKIISIYGNNRNTEIPKTERCFISKEDNTRLIILANNYKPHLIKILNNNLTYIRETFKESIYHDRLSFEEFFIWWYHFIYTDATNELAKKGLLSIPKHGNFYYEIEN